MPALPGAAFVAPARIVRAGLAQRPEHRQRPGPGLGLEQPVHADHPIPPGRHREMPTPRLLGLRRQRAVRVHRVQQSFRNLGQILRPQRLRGIHQELLVPLDLGHRQRGRQRVQRPGQHPYLLGPQLTAPPSGVDDRAHRVEHLTRERDPIPQRVGLPHPRPRLPRADPPQLDQHPGRRPRQPRVGQIPDVELGHERMIDGLQPPPGSLQPHGQIQELGLVQTPEPIRERHLDKGVDRSLQRLESIENHRAGHVQSLKPATDKTGISTSGTPPVSTCAEERARRCRFRRARSGSCSAGSGTRLIARRRSGRPAF